MGVIAHLRKYLERKNTRHWQECKSKFDQIDSNIEKGYREHSESYIVDFYLRKARLSHIGFVRPVVITIMLALSFVFLWAGFTTSWGVPFREMFVIFALLVLVSLIVYLCDEQKSKQHAQAMIDVEEQLLKHKGYLD